MGVGYNQAIVPAVIQRNVLKTQDGIRLTRLTRLKLHKVV